MVPCEGGMLLYKRLVRYQDECNRYQIRKVIHSNERERQRTLQVLGLLSNAKSLHHDGGKQNKTFDEKKKLTINKTTSITNKAQNLLVKSPYISKKSSHKLARDQRNRMMAKTSSSGRKSHFFEKSNRVVIPDDYIWHPPFKMSSSKKRKNTISSRASFNSIAKKSVHKSRDNS
jgi:hypothetical protein